MDRQDVLKRLLYPKCKSAIEFQFDNLLVNPLLTYITVQDIAQLYKIATSLKYSSRPKEKYAMIDKIMTNRGFKKMASGTNRVTYRCLNDYRVVIKIAIDKVGLSDNGNEYRNQQILKPFVTKCFEVSPCGTVGLFERVVPITSREEFINISDDIFDLINNLIGKYVLEDIGEKFYMNYGLREGFGPVLLDYPYVFELDGRKLICNVPEPFEPKGYCGGEIDYDLGYNDLICKKCGKRYLATELKSDIKSDKPKIIIEGEDISMRCTLRRGDEIICDMNEKEVVTNVIKPRAEVSRLRARLSVEPVEEEKVETYKPEIRTRDEVQLKARLRGTPRGKNIDEEAIKKEEMLNRNSTFIPMSFEPEVKEPVKEVSNFDARLSSEEPKQEDIIDVVVEEVKDEDKSDSLRCVYEVVINEDGEIININDSKVIGYTSDAIRRITESIFKSNTSSKSEEKDTEPEEEEVVENKNEEVVEEKDNEVVYSDPDGKTTIGDIIGSEFASRSENYKTNNIVAPIDKCFSSSEVKESEPEEEEVVEEREIPEIIIYGRDEDDTSYNDEDYDPEYSDVEEEESPTEDELKLY